MLGLLLAQDNNTQLLLPYGARSSSSREAKVQKFRKTDGTEQDRRTAARTDRTPANAQTKNNSNKARYEKIRFKGIVYDKFEKKENY